MNDWVIEESRSNPAIGWMPTYKIRHKERGTYITWLDGVLSFESKDQAETLIASLELLETYGTR
jgi:hypothetical protein